MPHLITAFTMDLLNTFTEVANNAKSYKISGHSGLLWSIVHLDTIVPKVYFLAF